MLHLQPQLRRQITVDSINAPLKNECDYAVQLSKRLKSAKVILFPKMQLCLFTGTLETAAMLALNILALKLTKVSHWY